MQAEEKIKKKRGRPRKYPLPLEPQLPRKRGRPAHQSFQPTVDQRRMVQVLVAAGVPEIGIVKSLINVWTNAPISLHTLRKHFRDELDNGMMIANGMVAQSLFNKAIGDGPTSLGAAIFWLKTRARWRENQAIELTGADGAPLFNERERESLRDKILAEAAAATVTSTTTEIPGQLH